MGKTNQAKIESQFRSHRPLQDDIKGKIRLDVNDLLKRRQEEKKFDKKTNLMVLSGAAAVAVVIFVILSL